MRVFNSKLMVWVATCSNNFWASTINTEVAEWVSNSEIENRLNTIQERFVCIGWNLQDKNTSVRTVSNQDSWVKCYIFGKLALPKPRQAEKEQKEKKKVEKASTWRVEVSTFLVIQAYWLINVWFTNPRHQADDDDDADDDVQMVAAETQAEEEDESGTAHLKADWDCSVQVSHPMKCEVSPMLTFLTGSSSHRSQVQRGKERWGRSGDQTYDGWRNPEENRCVRTLDFVIGLTSLN